jgi:hypothetical protein
VRSRAFWRLRVSVFLAGALLLIPAAPAIGGVGEWKTYTAKREVRDLVVSGDMVWVATSGGMFSYSLSGRTFSQFTPSEGLRTIDLTAITIDRRGNVWVGASNGILHRYEPAAKHWGYVLEIANRDDAPQKRINTLHAFGDTLFVCSDLGLSLYISTGDRFGDTYRRFGAGNSIINGGVWDVSFHAGKLWVATRTGVACTPLSNSNPAVPESWQVFRGVGGGLPSDNVMGFGRAGDTLYAATAAGLAYFDGTVWVPIASTAGQNIVGITPERVIPQGCSGPPLVYFATGSELLSIHSSSTVELVASGFPSPLTVLRAAPSMIGTRSNGIVVFDGCPTGSWTTAVPEGAPSNRFVGLAVDERGVVWSGTGSASTEGFMSFNGTSWRHYTTEMDSRLGSNAYFKVSIGKDNAKWVGNWGRGVALLDDQGNIRNVFNTTNGIPTSVPNDPTYPVVGGVATDRDGKAWIANRTGPDSIAVVVFNPADSSISYPARLKVRDPDIAFTDIVIDGFGTKWFANFSRFENVIPSGLYFYNEQVAIPGAGSNRWGVLTTANGLSSNSVWSLAVDRDGQLWIGTNQGITIILDTSNPRARVASYHPAGVASQIIQAIVVDPLNNKWLATKEGVFVYSPDGTVLLEHYTSENTQGKLLDNDVASLAFDKNSGTVYFGTEKGLSSLTTALVAPTPTIAEILVSPNPFYLPSSTLLTVDGLAQGSSLKILTVDGKVIRELTTPGGRIGFWDGRDEEGRFVASGVYFVVAFADNGRTVGTGKVAVIRK